jgi:hypothetical protein
MIAEVIRGNHMPDLVSYLFGPGRHNEHVDQHLVAGYADAVFTADDKLWHNEPGTVRRVRDEARELGWQLEFPRSRWATEIDRGYVWHCSLSLSADEGQLTDPQWTQAAHTLIARLGFDGADGKAPCRWIAVRHGPSSNGNDHIHIAVNLVREDGTKASTWNDYRKAGQACIAIEQRFGLQPVPGRSTGRSVPEPSRKDREVSAARGEPEPLRVYLERTVRACAAAARSEAHFVALVRQRGLLIRPRYSPSGTTAVTGYAVASPTRQAFSRRTGTTGPVWFGGGRLASDLSLPSLRRRWPAARTVALAAWSVATSLSPQPPGKNHGTVMSIGDDLVAAADLLAAAADACEQDRPGPLAQAARLMAKAAQHQTPADRRPKVADIVSEMASMFLAVTGTASGTHCAVALMTEVAELIDTCASTCEVSALVHASVDKLAGTADRQARAVLATPIPKEVTMTELTHEEELLSHFTAGGVMAARLLRTALGQPPGADAPDVKALKAAGYREETPYDEHLRQVLGEQRWAKYTTDPARIVCAALITDGAAAGRDMPALLSKAADIRAWEEDTQSPARSIARVLAYRIKRELDRPTSMKSTNSGIRTNGGAPARPVPVPMPTTPWDDHLRSQLGDHRWQQYAGGGRRRDIATLLDKAHAAGHDVPALITQAVTCREWEDDPRSPSRQVGGVLHYRLKAAVASSTAVGGLPAEVAKAITSATAPASTRTDPAPRAADSAMRQVAHGTRPSPGRDRE